QISFGAIPVLLRTRDFAGQTPSFDEVFARPGPRREIETGSAVIARGGEIAALPRQLAQANEHPDRVPVPHPQARRCILVVLEDAVVDFLCELQIATAAHHFAEVELRVWLRAGIAAAPADLRADGIERLRLIEVAEFGVQPTQGVHEPMTKSLIAYVLGEGETLVHRSTRRMEVALAGSRQSSHKILR